MNGPLFITLEGPDGSGKSTQASLLARALRAAGADVIETREPGGTPVGEQIRHVLLDPAGPPMSPLTMAFLLCAARAQHVEDVILPALGADRIVISDRYADSTAAYQGFGLGLDRDITRVLAAIATGGLTPDVTIFVDIEPHLGLQRVASRGAGNRLDALELANHRRIREGYLRLVAEEPDRWLVVDGSGPPEEVHDSIMRALRERRGLGVGVA